MLLSEHLYLSSRAGFGWNPTVTFKPTLTREEAVNGFLFARRPKPLSILSHPLSGKKKDEITNFQLLLSVLRSQKDLEALNVAWIKRMQQSDSVLHEKMILFWHNHFATRSPFAYLAQVQHNTILQHAMGSFRDLLHAMAKDTAMILFLNNQQNVKDHPNENFAREVMELFTLGEGHYTEKDIQEAARCFTGWQVNRQAAFEKVTALQDQGSKMVFGHQVREGEEVIDLLLNNKQTAYYITEKIWKAFVHPHPTSNDIQPLADQFYQSDYNIRSLLYTLFTSDNFYATANQGMLIASPVELLVRHSRLLAIEWRKDKQLIRLQRILGQVLFYPPNVAGWPGGRHWIDSSTLLVRSNLPLQYWQAYSGNNQKLARKFSIQPSWVDKTNEVAPWLDDLIDKLIPVPIPKADREAILARSQKQRKAPYVAALLSLLSLPEAQLI